MKGSIIVSYPEFGKLPLAIKLLLLTSENFSFDARATVAGVEPFGASTVTFAVPKTKLASALHRWSVN